MCDDIWGLWKVLNFFLIGVVLGAGLYLGNRLMSLVIK